MNRWNQISIPYRIVLAQLAVGGFLSLGFGAVNGLAAGFAVALGTVIVVLPNAWLAWRVTGSGAAESPARILALSLTKFLTTAGAAALALAVIKPSLAGFLAGLVATVLTAALVPPFLAPQQLARAPRL